MTHAEFIDLCILCGCDYTANINGVGPVKAFKFIKDEGTIENVVAKIKRDTNDPKKKQKYNIPDTFFYNEARLLFSNPDAETSKEVLEASIKWNKPLDEDLVSFLVKEKGFNEQKVDNGLTRLKKCVGKAN